MDSSRTLLFTGHMIDAPGRKEPRFPPDQEGVARRAIREAIEAEQRQQGGVASGIAGGANGGDILLHEICGELGIPTQLYLAVPPEKFIEASVAPARGDWVERFQRLAGKLPVHVLADKVDDEVWARANLRMLESALAAGGERVTLIALWNGQKGDGPGGTEDLVARAGERHARVVILDTRKLFARAASDQSSG